jgi:hypothetical protein
MILVDLGLPGASLVSSPPRWPQPASSDEQDQVGIDTVASEIAPYHDAAASQVALRLDTEVLDLLRKVTRARDPDLPEPPPALPTDR